MKKIGYQTGITHERYKQKIITLRIYIRVISCKFNTLSDNTNKYR